MRQDDTERTIAFILQQQAQFAADIQQLKELHAQAEKRMTRLENVVVRLANDTETKFSALLEAQTRTETSVARLAESQTALAEAQLHTDERMNAMIDIVAGRGSDNDGRGE